MTGCLAISNRLYESIRIFNEKGINLIPLYRVNSNNNTKKAYCDALFAGWQNTRRYYKDNVRALKNGVEGFAVQTGYNSGVFVVDLDDYKDTSYPEVKDYLLSLNTFYVKTPSGGYHFYFKYDKLMSSNKKGIFGNIDIRSAKGCCFFGNRADGNYEIFDNEIKECPKKLLTKLYEYFHIPDKKEIDKAPVFNVDIKNTKKYNISTKSLLYLLSYLDDDYVDDFSKWYVITAVLKKANYYDAWKEWSMKSDKYNEKNNDFIWSKINTDKTNNDLNYIVYLVNEYSSKSHEKKANIEVIHQKYNALSKSNIKKINKVINQKYLTPELYNDIVHNAILLIQSGLGTGKTFNTFQWCIENNHKLISIVHLTSLNDNQIATFNKHGETANMKMKSYQNIKQFVFSDDASICTTINSLVKTLNHIDVSEYYIYIDEIHRIISYLLHSSTLNNKRRDAYKALTKALKECKGVIGTDGDICDTTIKYLEDIKLNINFIKNEYKSFQDIPVKFYNNHTVIKKVIAKYVFDKKTFTLCCNTKSEADRINKLIKSLGVDTQDIKLYTSHSGEVVANVNEDWEAHYVLYSPSIVEGVDRTSSKPETVFVLVSSEQTIDPEQVKQQICRNRNIQEVHIGFNKMHNKIEYNSFDDIKTAMMANVDVFNNNFKEFLDTKLNEEACDEYTENQYSNLYIMSSYRNNILKANFKYNLKNILTDAGFIVNDEWENDDCKISHDIDDSQDIVKIEDETEELFHMYINNTLSVNNKFYKLMEDRCDICNIPRKDVEQFKDILVDKYNFSTYLNIRQLVKNDVSIIEKFKNDVDNEFIIKYYQDNVPIMMKYKHMMKKYVPEIDIYQFQYSEQDNFVNDCIDVDDADFKYIKSVIRTKQTEKPANKCQFLKLMGMYIKKFFGKNMVRSKRGQYREGKKQINYYIYEFNNNRFKSIIDLYRYSVNDDNIANIDDVVLRKYGIKPYNRDVITNIPEVIDVDAPEDTDDDETGSLIVDE